MNYTINYWTIGKIYVRLKINSIRSTSSHRVSIDCNVYVLSGLIAAKIIEFIDDSLW